MSDNPILQWITKDKQLSDLLVSIDNEIADPEMAAEKAFHEVSKLYNLPKFPEDVVMMTESEEEFFEDERNKSVFEQLAIHKAVFPDSDIRGSVLAACLAVYKKFYYTIQEGSAEYYGSHDNIPETYYAYFIGTGSDVTIEFSETENAELQKKARVSQNCFNEL